MKTLTALSGFAVLSFLLSFATVVSPVLEAQERRDDRRSETQNRRYHDTQHKDDHEWNDREDRAYHMWIQQNHRKDREFSRLKARDQQAYWNWRHNHSDAELKIDVR